MAHYEAGEPGKWVADPEDRCENCHKEFEVDADEESTTDAYFVVTVPIEVEAGKFCSKKCASEGACAKLDDHGKAQARQTEFALQLLMDVSRTQPLYKLIDAEREGKTLDTAAGLLASELYDDDPPAWAVDASVIARDAMREAHVALSLQAGTLEAQAVINEHKAKEMPDGLQSMWARWAAEKRQEAVTLRDLVKRLEPLF